MATQAEKGKSAAGLVVSILIKALILFLLYHSGTPTTPPKLPPSRAEPLPSLEEPAPPAVKPKVKIQVFTSGGRLVEGELVPAETPSNEKKQ